MVLLLLLVTISLQEEKPMEATEVTVVASSLLQIHLSIVSIILDTNIGPKMEQMVVVTDVMVREEPILHFMFRLVH